MLLDTDIDLIYDVLSGEADAKERDAFQKLLDENESFKKEFDCIGHCWFRGRFASKWKLPDQDRAWKCIEDRYKGRSRHKRWYVWGVAASLLLLVGVAVTVILKIHRPSAILLPINESVAESVHAKARLVLASGEKIELGGQNVRKISDGEFVIAADSAELVYPVQNMAVKPVFNELIVPVGGEYRLCLSDSTVVYLNSESRLRYPVNFGQEERSVELEGEAYFEVSPDQSRPFRVKAGQLDVEVLGTGFNVSAYKNDSLSEVTLAHGIVAVQKKGRKTLLKPDEQFVLYRGSGVSLVRSVDAGKICDWRNGNLYFEGMTLEDLGVKLARWYDLQFFFTSEKLKQLKFSGTFQKYGDVNCILSFIEASADIKIQIRGKTVIVTP